MSRQFLVVVPPILLAGCSVLVGVDDEKYTGGATESPSTGGDHSLGGATSGGTGGNSGGGTGGGSGGETGGTAGTGGTTGGTGGEPVVTVPAPLHYYPLDEESGGVAPDAGTGNVDGRVTMVDNWLPTSGVKGGAYEVAGDNAYFELPSEVTNTSPFTVSWWFVPSIDGYRLLLSKSTNQDSVGGYVVISDSGNIIIRIGDQNTDEFRPMANHPDSSEGKWTQMAFAYERDASGTQDRVALWMNGENVLDETRVLMHSGENASAAVRFGFQEGGSSSSPFQGLVDEVRVYDRVLTDEEVEAIYEFDREE